MIDVGGANATPLSLRHNLSYSTECPGTHSVDQAGLELTELRLLCLPSAGIKGVRHSPSLTLSFTLTLYLSLVSML